MKKSDELLRNAAHHLMDHTNIWYDRRVDEKGNAVRGPIFDAVTILCRLASDIRAGVLKDEKPYLRN